MTRVGRSLGWLARWTASAAAALLLVTLAPGFARAQIACTGPVSGPTAYCPDCIYDTYGEFDTSRSPDDFACGQFTRLRPLSTSMTLFQYADPFLVEGGPYRLESVTIRLRRPSLLTTPGDVAVRVWDDADVLGNDDPEDPQSFLDNEPGGVLARASVPAADICTGSQIVPGACDETRLFDANPSLVDGAVYWISATMAQPETGATWAKTTGENSMLVCSGPNCSDEWKYATSNGETPTWNAAQFVEAIGLVRLVPEPSSALLRAAALAILAGLARGRRRRS